MAEYTIPKPYRDFYVTDPYVGLQKEVEDLQKYSNPFSTVEYGSVLHGENTLPDKEIAVKVESKNLIPYPYLFTTHTANGGTFTAQADGGITASGTPTAYSGITIANIPVESNTQYFFSQSGTYSNVTFDAALKDSDNNQLASIPVNSMIDTSLYPNASYINVWIRVVTQETEMSGTIYPQIEKGDTVTSYALYQPEGTPVTVTTCGKNLLNVSDNLTFTYIYEINDLHINAGQTVTLSCSQVIKGGDYSPSFVFFNDSGFVKELAVTTTPLTYTFTKPATKVKIYSNTYDWQLSQGVTSTIKNLMLEYGHEATLYEPYKETVIETEVGKEIVSTQLNDITNINSNDFNVSLSTRFILYNEELFHDKLTAIIGTFANRPTDITDYDRLYIATDKTDTSRSTILPAGKSGATASNWIYI